MHSVYRFIYLSLWNICFALHIHHLQIENINLAMNWRDNDNLTLFLNSPFFIKGWIWSRLELTYQNTSKSIILFFSTFRSFWSCLIGAAAEFLVFCALYAILLAGGQRDNSTSTLRSHIINIPWQLWMTSSFSHAWFCHRYTGLAFAQNKFICDLMRKILVNLLHLMFFQEDIKESETIGLLLIKCI